MGIIDQLNKDFESRVRLGIMSILVVNDWVDFSEMKTLLNLTDGNLASHSNALEKANYIEVKKEFIGKKALLKLQGDDKIALYNKDNENEPLKKSQTQVYDFDSYILDNANELELIQKSNGGERFNDKGSKPDGNEPKQLTGLAAKMAAITE